jgi:hypothetical protein
MDDQIIIGIASAVGVSIGLGIHQARQAKLNAKLGERIVAVLREQDERTLADIAGALDMSGVFGRGKVFNALTAMVNEGSLQVIPAPEGTPQLQKVKHIKYKLRSAA